MFLRLPMTLVVLTSAVVTARETDRANPAAPAVESSTNDVHWSLRPVTRPTVPAVANPKWKPRNPIDNFIFARLAQAKLSPSPEAPRVALVRRLYFDLLGLPPTPAEAKAFERDGSPDAYEKLVERLLASPRYGERWARHWLDVVRFAETHGFEMNQPRPTAWLYRDYIIRAFNEDKPYNRFILEQFAGDVFGEDAATGFLVGGPWDQVKSPDPVLTAAQRADELHDMVSTTGSAFLGLTVGCARCHNHKFDPIPQLDYYAIKACLAGVEHGERPLHTAEFEEQERQTQIAKGKLAEIESRLAAFEPMAATGRVLLLEPEPAFGSRQTELLEHGTRSSFPAGTARGERDDPGDLERLPTLTRAYLVWSNAPNKDLFAFSPQLAGRFRIWISWAGNIASNVTEAVYFLDRDGDLNTTNDQVELARINQQQFADGAAAARDKMLWSGFYNGGAWELTASNRIVLRCGSGDALITAGVLALVEEPHTNNSSNTQFLRASVNPRRNVERFVPTRANRLRFTVARTTDAEPCIDELEVYTTDGQNIALASAGTKATASSVFPNSDLHRLEHINDGKFGNSHSWISNERGKGWIELEFPREVTIDRVVWGRDREQQFSDRLALEYRVEVSGGSDDWHLVATSLDRVPYVTGRPVLTSITVKGLADSQAQEVRKLLDQRTECEATIKKLGNVQMVYAGKFTEKPAAIHRLFRGDAMQERETVEPGALSAIQVPFRHCTDGVPEVLKKANPPGTSSGAVAKTPLTEDQQRRLDLATWIGDPANPLPARVIVNRLWQHHFGEGLVSTPSDFGRKGALPSHPELLDWLAAELVHPSMAIEARSRNGATSAAPPWSLKHIQRLIVTSAVYRQASVSRPECLKVDTASRLLWRYPPQRLEAEPLRDAILAISGKLDLKEGGPGFSVFEPNDNYVRVYNPKVEFGPAEWRRMVYMTKVRMQQDATFGAFDCPDAGQIAPKRMRSTTPLQALNLLNSEFVLQQADFFAERLQREASKDIKAQVHLAFELAYGREPDRVEMRAAEALVLHQGLPALCRAIYNSNEFIFVE